MKKFHKCCTIKRGDTPIIHCLADLPDYNMKTDVLDHKWETVDNENFIDFVAHKKVQMLHYNPATEEIKRVYTSEERYALKKAKLSAEKTENCEMDLFCSFQEEHLNLSLIHQNVIACCPEIPASTKEATIWLYGNTAMIQYFVEDLAKRKRRKLLKSFKSNNCAGRITFPLKHFSEFEKLSTQQYRLLFDTSYLMNCCDLLQHTNGKLTETGLSEISFFDNITQKNICHLNTLEQTA